MNDMGKIFGKFDDSKVDTHKIITGTSRNNGMPTVFGQLVDIVNVPFKSKTKPVVNPTTTPGPAYGMGNAGGASGDKDVGYLGGGAGIAQLNGSHGNDAKRSINKL